MYTTLQYIWPYSFRRSRVAYLWFGNTWIYANYCMNEKITRPVFDKAEVNWVTPSASTHKTTHPNHSVVNYDSLNFVFKNRIKTPFSSSSVDKTNGLQFILNSIPAHEVGAIIKKCIQDITNLIQLINACIGKLFMANAATAEFMHCKYKYILFIENSCNFNYTVSIYLEFIIFFCLITIINSCSTD